jgi:hypothetical protein
MECVSAGFRDVRTVCGGKIDALQYCISLTLFALLFSFFFSFFSDEELDALSQDVNAPRREAPDALSDDDDADADDDDDDDADADVDDDDDDDDDELGCRQHSTMYGRCSISFLSSLLSNSLASTHSHE